MHTRKPPKLVTPDHFRPWTPACFFTREARDRFLQAASNLPTGDVEAEPVDDDSRVASVRWRPGKFLGLNDVAYAHGGKILVAKHRGL